MGESRVSEHKEHDSNESRTAEQQSITSKLRKADASTSTTSYIYYKVPSTGKYACNPCACCMFCGVNLRMACIFIFVFDIMINLPSFFTALYFALVDQNQQTICDPDSPGGFGNLTLFEPQCRNKSFYAKNVTNCQLLETCKSQLIVSYGCVMGSALCYVFGAFCLGIVVATLRAPNLIYGTLLFGLVAEILAFVAVCYQQAAIIARDKLHPTQPLDPPNPHTSIGIVSIVLKLLYTIIRIYFSACAVALFLQIRAGEYDQDSNKIDAAPSTMVGGKNDKVEDEDEDDDVESPAYSKTDNQQME